MDHGRPEVLQGTLDLMILKALDALGPLHGFGIARRLEQVSDGVLRLNEGTVYTALLRLGQRGWIRSSWGVSDSNRKARFYAITAVGRRRLAREEQGWNQIAGIVDRVMKLAPEEE
jgi:transcriptional regulator